MIDINKYDFDLEDDDIFVDLNHSQIEIIQSSPINIECEVPEIGPKIENLSTNDKYNKKDYYNNYYKKIYFYPFFNMDKDDNNIYNEYTLKYNDDDRYNLYILKENKYKEIKLQINNKGIIQIAYNKFHDDDKIELFIYLRNVPKVYSKGKDKNFSKPFYFENFEYNLYNYDYYNLYRNIDKNNPEKYFKVFHKNKILNKNKIIVMR